MSTREDTPFSDVFSEFFGSTGWVRLGRALISLNVKERILNHMVSSSRESFLCSSETFLKQKNAQIVHFTQPATFKALSLLVSGQDNAMQFLPSLGLSPASD